MVSGLFCWHLLPLARSNVSGQAVDIPVLNVYQYEGLFASGKSTALRSMLDLG